MTQRAILSTPVVASPTEPEPYSRIDGVDFVNQCTILAGFSMLLAFESKVEISLPSDVCPVRAIIYAPPIFLTQFSVSSWASQLGHHIMFA
jgi:hypothetical protein